MDLREEGAAPELFARRVPLPVVLVGMPVRQGLAVAQRRRHHVANATRSQPLLDKTHPGMHAELVAHRPHESACLDAVDQLLDTLPARGERLLDEYVATSSHAAQGGVHVQCRRVGDEGDVGPLAERAVELIVLDELVVSNEIRALVDTHRVVENWRATARSMRDEPHLRRKPSQVAEVPLTDRSQSGKERLHASASWNACLRT